jgi:inner membrane protein
MEPQKTQPNAFQQLNSWIKGSVMVKFFSIGFLILLLLIPSSWIESLIIERQSRLKDVIKEVSQKWSGEQTISGPIIMLPYFAYEKVEKDGKMVTVKLQKRAYFLPDDLNIHTTIEPKTLNRGIFDVIVYKTDYKSEGSFSFPNIAALNITDEDVLWNEARIIIGIKDLRGIIETPEFSINDHNYFLEPSHEDKLFHGKTITSKIDLNSEANAQLRFKLNLAFKGSGELGFLPMGKSTNVTTSGNWSDPSFGGSYLPIERSVNDSSFTATWNILHFNRPFPQHWIGEKIHLEEAKFGLQLLIPVDQYQKSIRTAKYSILIIILTFTALFFIEILCKIRIHPFQYILIGAALIIYYSLLLSLSEHLGFNTSYLIASIGTVILITAYAKAIFSSSRIIILLSLLLSVFYTFIFTITQMQDFALLLGSLGLFIIIGVLMYVSRKVNWYSDEVPESYSATKPNSI